MNYISHLNQFLATSYKDERLTSTHISMYLALFYIWNSMRFNQNFFINRDTVMALSHIGSKSTYLRMLDELHAFGYIRHEKPTGKYGRSRICIRRFSDKPNDPQLQLFDNYDKAMPGSKAADDPSNAVQNSTPLHASNDTRLRSVLIRQNTNPGQSLFQNRSASQPKIGSSAVPKAGRIININSKGVKESEIDKAPTRHMPLKKNNSGNTKTDGAGGEKNGYSVNHPVDNHTAQIAEVHHHCSECKTCTSGAGSNQTERMTSQEPRPQPRPQPQPQPRPQPQPQPPAFADVKQFFIREISVNASAYSLKVFGRNNAGISPDQAIHEALKFYSHYAAIGWMLGGINPIINWKAAARKWLLNCWHHMPPAATKKDSNAAPANYHVANNNDKDYCSAL